MNVIPALHRANEAACGCCGCGEARNIASELSEATGSPQPKTTGGYTGEGSASTNDYLSALVSGYAWDNTSPITYYLAYSDADANGVNDWSQDGARAAIKLAFEQISNVADVTFEEVFVESQANLVENIVPDSTWTQSGVLGDHYFPSAFNVADGRYNIDGYGWNAAGLQQGGYGFVTLIHEIGHGMGLEHPHDGDRFPGVTSSGDTGDYGLNQGVYTTMSYIDGWNGDGPDYQGVSYGWQGTMMAFDIAALQQMYGANTTHASGNDVYEMPRFNAAGTYYESIWDTGGTDSIVYNGSDDTTINLTAATIDASATGGGAISRADGIKGGFTIAQGVVIENASGGSGADSIIGNAAANSLSGNDGVDVILGGAGNDTVLGGNQSDTLNGQSGDDAINGQAGWDRLWGADGNDSLYGAAGNDFIYGGRDQDRIFGGNDNDQMNGQSGNDQIYGGAGGDRLWGAYGNDLLDGGTGNDLMWGGANNDTFVFANGWGRDTIYDFDSLSAAEVIDLSGASNITSFADLQSDHLSVAGSNVIITDGANTITLYNISIASIDASDFVF